MTKATISSNGHIAIPKSMRDRLHLKPGMQVALDVQGDQIVMKPVLSGLPHWSTMRGMLRDAGNLLDDLTQERAADLARDDDRLKNL